MARYSLTARGERHAALNSVCAVRTRARASCARDTPASPVPPPPRPRGGSRSWHEQIHGAAANCCACRPSFHHPPALPWHCCPAAFATTGVRVVYRSRPPDRFPAVSHTDGGAHGPKPPSTVGAKGDTARWMVPTLLLTVEYSAGGQPPQPPVAGKGKAGASPCGASCAPLLNPPGQTTRGDARRQCGRSSWRAGGLAGDAERAPFAPDHWRGATPRLAPLPRRRAHAFGTKRRGRPGRQIPFTKIARSTNIAPPPRIVGLRRSAIGRRVSARPPPPPRGFPPPNASPNPLRTSPPRTLPGPAPPAAADRSGPGAAARRKPPRPRGRRGPRPHRLRYRGQVAPTPEAAAART